MTNDFYEKAIPKLFYIINKDMEAVPFVPNDPQKRINKDLGRMDIILKARQEGISSWILARFTLDFLQIENIRCVVISHEQKATQRLFDRVKYFLESMQKTWPTDVSPLPFTLKYNSRSELVNTQNNSTFYIGTAGARAFGHGDTINNLHVSELSRWPDQEGTLLGLLQAVPKSGRVIIETTANGWGDHFCKLWLKMKDKQEPWKTHFLPWFELKEYVMPAGNLEVEGNGLTEEEQNLTNAYGLSKEQIAWRRWKIAQLGEADDNHPKFSEQFPSNAEEAFIMSGNPVWSPTLMKWHLLKCDKPKEVGNLQGYNPISLEENEKGYVRVWKPPKEFHRYVIGVDVSEGKVVSEMEGGKERDFSCAQVLDKTTYEQVAVWHGRVDPDLLGRQMEMLGRWYNNALIAVERNAIGLTPLITLRDLNYPNLYYQESLGMMKEKTTPNLGWRTDVQSKELLVNDATNLFRDKRLVIHDEDTVGEMISYMRDASGHANAAKSAFDDRVMSLMIAIRMLSRPQSFNNDNPIESSEHDFFGQGGFTMGGVTFDSTGMPVDPDGGGGESMGDF